MSRRRRRPLPQYQPRSDDVRQVIREELSKALALPPGAHATEVSTGYLQALQRRDVPAVSANTALTRDAYGATVHFGPGEPLVPAPLDPSLPSGRPAPRRWEYPVTWNLQTTTTRTTPWTVLRDAADQVSIMRACIEVCKSAVTGLEWSFGIDSARARHIARREGTSDRAVDSDLQDKYADDIERLHNWWVKPDRINNWTFSEWLGAMLEDQLVLDAVALYPHMALGGDLHSLELLDATTIKPLLDWRGATPQPPLAAYQQILWGFPRGEFDQASSPDHVDHEFVSAIYGNVTGVHADTDTLIYKVRNRRTRGPYGFSCVEQALADIDLWLKRFEWLRAEYTAGITPQMMVMVDTNMTPEQLRQYEAVFNDDLSGRTEQRHRARFLPAGFTADYPQAHEAKFTSDLDLHLVRLICAAFDVLPTSVGFTPNHGMGGMGGQGQQAAESDTQLARGTKPTAQWIVDLVNEVSANYLGMPPEVTFRFHGLDDEDEQREATLLTGYIGTGLQTLNEGRDQLNLPRYGFPEANQPFLNTPTGPAFLNVAVQPVDIPGNIPSAPRNHVEPNASYSGGSPDNIVSNRDSATDTTAAAVAKSRRAREVTEFESFLVKAAGVPHRDFVFRAFPPKVGEAANELARAGDVDACRALFALYDED